MVISSLFRPFTVLHSKCLSDNLIEDLPESVCNLKHVKSLCLDNNNVKQVCTLLESILWGFEFHFLLQLLLPLRIDNIDQEILWWLETEEWLPVGALLVLLINIYKSVTLFAKCRTLRWALRERERDCCMLWCFLCFYASWTG